ACTRLLTSTASLADRLLSSIGVTGPLLLRRHPRLHPLLTLVTNAGFAAQLCLVFRSIPMLNRRVSWLRYLLATLVLAGLYDSTNAEEAVPSDKALLIVRLPAAAALTIASYVTQQTGTERYFLSP